MFIQERLFHFFRHKVLDIWNCVVIVKKMWQDYLTNFSRILFEIDIKLIVLEFKATLLYLFALIMMRIMCPSQIRVKSQPQLHNCLWLIRKVCSSPFYPCGSRRTDTSYSDETPVMGIMPWRVRFLTFSLNGFSSVVVTNRR